MSFKQSIEYNLNHSEFGESLFDRFEIVEEIYRSTLSYIYKIKSKESGKLFILKAIKRQEDFEFNIDIADRISHKHIVKLEEYGYSEQFLYIIREYIEGVNLEQYIKQNGPLSKDEVAKILEFLSDALNYLHHFEDGAIIFRDLKPSNIMITSEGEPILIDIITIRAISEDKETDTFYIGSKGYAAPEQYGYMQSNEKSDVFSLGATLYYMVTGEHPEQLDKEQIRKLDVSNRIKRTLLKATQFSPDKRHRSIETFMSDLKRPFDLLKVSITTIVLIVLFTSIYTYQNQPETFDVDRIKSSEDIHMDTLIALEEGLEFSYDEEGQMILNIDRERLSSEIRDFEFLSIGLAYESFNPILIKEAIFKGLKEKVGFSAYPDAGYAFNIEDKNNLYLALYSNEQEPLAYYIYSDFKNPNILEPGVVEVDRISESVTFHYYEDHIRVSVDQDKEEPFTKMAVYSNPVGFDEYNKADIREDSQNKLNVREYMMPGMDFGYGMDGVRDRLSWMVVLLDDDYNIVKEYLHYDDYVSEDFASKENEVDAVPDEAEELIDDSELVTVSGSLQIEFNSDHMTVIVDQEKEVPFTRISVWSNSRGLNEESKDWIRNEGIVEEDTDYYKSVGQVNGYGPTGIRDGLSWFIVLLDDELNILKEYEYYDDYLSEPLEIDEVSEGVFIYYYDQYLRVIVDEKYETPFARLSVWSQTRDFNEGDKDWIKNEGVNENNARSYMAGGHVSGYGADGIRDGQYWMIVFLDDDLNVVDEQLLKDDYLREQVSLVGDYQVTEGIDIYYNEFGADIKVNSELLPEFTRFSIWGTASGLSDETWERTREKVINGDGIQPFNEKGYSTGYGNIGSFTGQDWMIFLLDDNKIIEEYGIDF